jgi:hypothetical protein
MPPSVIAINATHLADAVLRRARISRQPLGQQITATSNANGVGCPDWLNVIKPVAVSRRGFTVLALVCV